MIELLDYFIVFSTLLFLSGTKIINIIKIPNETVAILLLLYFIITLLGLTCLIVRSI